MQSGMAIERSLAHHPQLKWITSNRRKATKDVIARSHGVAVEVLKLLFVLDQKLLHKDREADLHHHLLASIIETIDFNNREADRLQEEVLLEHAEILEITFEKVRPSDAINQCHLLQVSCESFNIFSFEQNQYSEFDPQWGKLHET